MKMNESLAGLACGLALLSSWQLAAEQTAVIKDGHVNVRGQPSLAGEVITQLQKGEKVVVLEEITVAKPKTNEPARWARIQMPPNTPVWVSALYLDPTNKTVRVHRLNLRAGPGENFSVVGRLEKGASVNEIRRVDNWLEIETPPGAYAFVAANLLAPPEPAAQELAANPAPANPPPTAAAPVPESTKPEVTPPPQAAALNVPPPPSVNEATNQVVQAVPPPTEPPVQAPAAAPLPPVMVTEVHAPTPSKAPVAELPIPRIVRREGIVRSTVSIQAPTYYELLSPQNRKTINYLHTDKLAGINLKDYRGRRVIVSGEEAIDPRWPNTPLIEVDKLELIP